MAKSVLITKAVLPTGVVLGASINPSFSGQSVVFTAVAMPLTFRSSVPTGTITFFVDGVAQTPSTMVDGLATLSTTGLSVGTRLITAVYNGDHDYARSTSDTYGHSVTASFTTGWAPGSASVNARDINVITGDGTNHLVGDGVTDDAPALQAIIDKITSGADKPGQLLYFPAATYAMKSFFAQHEFLDLQSVSNYKVNNGGSGYTNGDTLTVVGGTFTTATQLTATVSGGIVTAVTLLTRGRYTVAPPAPSSVTGGTGTGCTVTVPWVCADIGGISGLVMVGDLGSDGKPASILTSSMANVVMVLGQEYWDANVRYMKFVANGSGSTAFQYENTSTFVFDTCDFAGYNGLFSYLNGSFCGNIRNCRFIGTPGFSNVGNVSSGATATTFTDCSWSGWLCGTRPTGATNAWSRCTYDSCITGVDMGATWDNNNGTTGACSMDHVTFTNCDVSLSISNASNNSYSNVTIVGSTGSPSGQSQYGIDAYIGSYSGFTNFSITGTFSGACVNIHSSSVHDWTFRQMTLSNSFGGVGAGTIWKAPAGLGNVTPGLPLYNQIAGTALTNVSLGSSTIISPVNIDDTPASGLKTGPDSQIVDVTSHGVVGNTVTDNYATFQAMLNDLSTYPDGSAFYFPIGKYLFNQGLDLTAAGARKRITLIGDGMDGTVLFGSGAIAFNCNYGTGIGQFHVRRMSLQNGDIGHITLNAINAALSSIEDCQVSFGGVGLSWNNCFKSCVRATLFTQTGSAPTFAAHFDYGYGTTLETCNTDGGPTVWAIGGSVNFAGFGCRAEVSHNGWLIGTDASSNAATVSGISLQALETEANDYAMIFQNVTNGLFAGIRTYGTPQAPSGFSHLGMKLENAINCQFIGVFPTGSYNPTGGTDEGWAWRINNPSNSILLSNCSAQNGYVGTPPPNFGEYENNSSGTVTKIACAF